MYPTVNDINDDGVISRWVSESLNTFFQYLMSSKLKRKTICQCIIQVSRPRSIVYSISYGLGVETESKFASNGLVNHLY